MIDRRRNSLILLLVAGLLIISVLFVIAGIPGVVKAKKTRLDDTPQKNRVRLFESLCRGRRPGPTSGEKTMSPTARCWTHPRSSPVVRREAARVR